MNAEWTAGSEPPSGGEYWITLKDGSVRRDCYYVNGQGETWWGVHRYGEIIAYAPVDYPEPYEPPKPAPLFWVAVDENGAEYQYWSMPHRMAKGWSNGGNYNVLYIGTIELLIRRRLTWRDEAVAVYAREVR